MNIRRALFAVAGYFVMTLALPVSGQGGGGKSGQERFEALKSQFDWHKGELESAKNTFDESYLGQLKKLEETAIAEGDLRLVLAVRAEEEEFGMRDGEVASSKHEELARLQELYVEQTKRIADEGKTKLGALLESYRKQLTALQDELTRADEIEAAVVVQAELKEIGGVAAVGGETVAASRPSTAPAPVPGAPVEVAIPSDGVAIRAVRAKLKALLVVQLEGSTFAGAASNLSAAAIPVGAAEEVTVTFNQDVGDSMKTALAEVIKFHKIRYQGWPKGKKVEISFEDKYSGKDGPSAAVACALLLESMLSGQGLDPMFAVTGDMNADGSVQPIGGVPAKIRGATNRTCDVVAIPAKNDRAVFDLVLSHGVAPLLEIQVFSIGTFAEALALAKDDRDEAVQASIDSFAQIQEVFSRPGAYKRGLLRNRAVLTKLGEVLKATPNHLSAQVLMAAARGTLPKTLSLAGSLDSIDNTSAIILRLVKSGGLNGGKFDALAGDELADAVSGLRRQRIMLDRRTWPYSDSIVDLGELLRTYKDNRPKDPSRRNDLVRQINGAASSINRQIDKIRKDSSMMEELLW